MAAYEYKTEVIEHASERHKGELKRSELEARLNALGREGWDIRLVFLDQTLQGEKDGHLLIFRRPL
jgi:Domain of unknown function (DUF4177)